MKIVLILIGVIAVLGLVAYGAGSLIPRDHIAARRLVLKSATPHSVWTRITDAAAAPRWRKDVKQVTRLPDRDGHEVWREEFASGNTLAYETIESVPPSRLVRRIVDEPMFGGTWTIVVTAEGAGAEVTLTENGWIESPPFRIVAKYMMGYDGTINAYLTDLAASFGETAKPSLCEDVCERPANSSSAQTESQQN
jgi:hypothetical protein